MNCLSSLLQVLAEINQTWSVMEFSYEVHQSTGTPLLKADENLIETLEDNQVTEMLHYQGYFSVVFNYCGLKIQDK